MLHAGDFADALGELDGTVDLVISNPPYIRAADPHLVEGDVRFEPESALVAGIDGLDDLREAMVATLAVSPFAFASPSSSGFNSGNPRRSAS